MSEFKKAAEYFCKEYGSKITTGLPGPTTVEGIEKLIRELCEEIVNSHGSNLATGGLDVHRFDGGDGAGGVGWYFEVSFVDRKILPHEDVFSNEEKRGSK